MLAVYSETRDPLFMKQIASSEILKARTASPLFDPEADLRTDIGSCPLWVTCGRRPGKDGHCDVRAALVGCGHVSGLLMRQVWPLALVLCADRVPIVRMHFKVR